MVSYLVSSAFTKDKRVLGLGHVDWHQTTQRLVHALVLALGRQAVAVRVGKVVVEVGGGALSMWLVDLVCSVVLLLMPELYCMGWET